MVAVLVLQQWVDRCAVQDSSAITAEEINYSCHVIRLRLKQVFGDVLVLVIDEWRPFLLPLG